MTTSSRYSDTLRELRDSEVAAYLGAHSGLPGPRGNLELADAFAGIGSPALVREFAASADEYLAVCGAIGLGELLARGDEVEPELRRLAADARWRVREGVARGLQRLGDAAPARLRELVLRWSMDDNPLVLRAAAAAICEPRLLKDPDTAALALDICRRATDALLAAGVRDRVLRQALGYCWSVAIVGAPDAGLAAFRELEANADPDAQWIVRENRTKSRLKKLLGA
jgi:hypothetical protein